jgi:hypothetical protein
MSYLIETTFTLSVLANAFLLIAWKYERKNGKYWNKLCDYWYTKYKELENASYIS